jgi:hypothetical protein
VIARVRVARRGSGISKSKRLDGTAEEGRALEEKKNGRVKENFAIEGRAEVADVGSA